MATLNLGRVRMVFKGDFESYNGQQLEFFDAVTFAGSLYVVKVETVTVDDSDNGNRPPTPNGQASFLQITEGVSFLGAWSEDQTGLSDRIYYKNQIVQYGPNTFIALQTVPIGRANPNVDLYTGSGYWEVLAKGFGNYIPNFNSTQDLDPGDIISYDSTVWLAIETVAVGENPSTDPDKFERLDGRLDPKGNWQAGTLYETSDVVVFHGTTYVVIAPSTSNKPVNQTGDINQDWQLLVQGFDWVGEFDPTSYEGYYKGDIVVYDTSTYVVLEKTQFQQNPYNTPTKFQLLLNGDSLQESDFTVDGFLVRKDAVITIDENTYLQENQNINLTGDATGSGKTNIAVTLTVDAVINQSTATESETNALQTTFLGAIETAPNTFELRKFSPELIRADLPNDFTPDGGIERISSETGPFVTLGLNDKIIANLDGTTETNLVPDLDAADQFMYRDAANETLQSISYQQLVNKLNTQIVGSNVDGVTNFRALIDTPNSYAGFKGGYLRINQAENAIEFAEDDILLQILIFG